jgi:MFS family permease
LLAWLVSAEAVFLQVPLIAALTAFAVMTIPNNKVDLRRARGLESGEGRNEGPKGRMTLLRNRALLVFGSCSFLYELADAPLLTLVGQRLGHDGQGSGLVLTSALIIASQLGMLTTSILVGKRADRLGYRWLLVAAFAMLPVQAVLTALLSKGSYLIALQVFGGLGTGLFSALTPIWLADVTRGSGHYNLSQGIMATLRALGVTSSSLLSELIVEHLGYSAAYIGCGVIGITAATLLWVGLPKGQAAMGSAGQHLGSDQAAANPAAVSTSRSS